MANPAADTASLPYEPGTHRRGLKACHSSGPTVPGAPCKGSRTSLRYPHSTAMTRICAPFNAAADNRTGTRYKKPNDDSGDSQSTQAISPISTTATLQTVSRLDSAYARSLSSLVISARLSHTGAASGKYLSHRRPLTVVACYGDSA